MGCCNKRRNSNAIEKLDDMKITLMDGTSPEKDIKIPVKDSFDMDKAKDLIKFLLSLGGMYDYLLSEVLNLDDNQFRNLFEGHFDINNCTLMDRDNKVMFEKLAIKIETYKYVFKSWYKKGDDYYECLKDIWSSFQDLYELSRINDLEKELDKICKSPKWTKEIRDDFIEIMKISDDMSEKYKIFLETNLVELDDVIKELSKSRKAIGQAEIKNEGKKNLKIDSSFDSLIKKILDSSISVFQDDYKSECKNKNISTENSDSIFNFSEKEKENLIRKVLIKYANADLDNFNFTDGLETLNKIIEKVNIGKLFSSDTKVKISIAAKNKIVPHVILGVSFLNLCNNIHYTYQLFSDSKNKIRELEGKLDNIKSKFIKHKKEIPLITGQNYNEDLRKIEELRVKFDEDKEEVKQLIEEINSSIRDQKDEKNKRIFQAIENFVATVGSAAAGFMSEEKGKKVEFTFSSLFSGVSLIGNSIDIKKLQSNIDEFNKILTNARALEQKINEEIQNLKKKYRDIQKMELPSPLRD